MNRIWVKICGNTSLADAQHAIRAGADAVGFVFAAESKRRVSAEQVAAITSYLPVPAETFGVFVEQSVDEIADIVCLAGLTGVQLHSPDMEHGAEAAVLLRERLSQRKKRLHLINVLHFGAADAAHFDAHMARIGGDNAIDALLLDSRSANAVGGTGIAFDWLAARKSWSRAAPNIRLIVAGGLTAENVEEAVRILTPWGVDVASGVESEVGKKDPSRVKNFIATARAAATGRARLEKHKLGIAP